LAEVALAEAEEDRAVDLGVAADEVLRMRPERDAVLVVPALGRDVALLAEDLAGIPVLGLAREVAAAFEQQDALPRRREPVRQGAAAGSRADDDDVVVVAHFLRLLSDEGDRRAPGAGGAAELRVGQDERELAHAVGGELGQVEVLDDEHALVDVQKLGYL